MNIMRVYLHHLAWQMDGQVLNRGTIYLSIADKHGIKTIFVFFDDCCGIQPIMPGYNQHRRPAFTIPGGRDPGQLLYDSNAVTTALEAYVKDVLNVFRYD